MLISEAYAQAGGGTTDMLTSLLPLVLIFVVFYFLLIRPQQKKMKDHKAMIEAVRRGDTVTTSGGIIGKVTKVQEDGVLQIEKIGRASCRERVCQYGKISVGAVALKKKKK